MVPLDVGNHVQTAGPSLDTAGIEVDRPPLSPRPTAEMDYSALPPS